MANDDDDDDFARPNHHQCRRSVLRHFAGRMLPFVSMSIFRALGIDDEDDEDDDDDG
jgi:hypothetical protein